MLVVMLVLGLLHAAPTDGEVLVKPTLAIADFLRSNGLELKELATNQKGWEGASRGYFGLGVFEETDIDALQKRIRPTFNFWSLLPNLHITEADQLHRLLKINRGGLYLPYFDLSVLESCESPEAQLKLYKSYGMGGEHIYVRGGHTVTQALVRCNPLLRIDLERIERIEIPLGHSTARMIRIVQVGDSLDSQSVEHLRGFTGPVIVHAEQFPKWLEQGTLDAKWSRLVLRGVTEISAKQAAALSALSDRPILLADLERLSTAAALQLSGSGSLSLPKLRKISARGMQALTAERKWLLLGIERLSPRVTAAIQGDDQSKVELPNVRTLSASSIRKLKPKLRRLHLGAFDDLDADRFELLMTYAGKLYFPKGHLDVDLFRFLDDYVRSKPIPRWHQWAKGRMIYTSRSVDAEVLRLVLAEKPDNTKRHFPNLQQLSVESAEHLRASSRMLKLPALIDISAEALGVLSQVEQLELNGLRSLSVAQAQAIARSPSKEISLKGIEHISITALEALCTYSGKLNLPSWLLSSYDAKPYLMHYDVGVISAGRLHPKVFDTIHRLRAPKLRLSLPAEFSAAQAAQLAKFPGARLELVTERISLSAAQALASFQGGSMHLTLRSEPEAHALSALSTVSGQLIIDSRHPLENHLVELELLPLLKEFRGQKLVLNNIDELTETMIAAALERDYRLEINAKRISVAGKAMLQELDRQWSGYIPDNWLCSERYAQFENGYCIEQEEMMEEGE